MSELRHDPIQKRWVIVSTERARRPSDFHILEPELHIPFSPFSEGNEDKTPPEVFAIRSPESSPNTPGWSVRVVPNKFAALNAEGDLGRTGVGVYDQMNGIGVHEVIIETPQADLHLPDMPLDQVERIVFAYRRRLQDLMQDGRLRYVLIFKNQGTAAGAALSHPHTQVIGLPVTPKTVRQELISAQEHYLRKERCLFCDVIQQELAAQQRVVMEDEDFVALVPFASRFPFEVFLAPKRHAHDFSRTSDADLGAFARALKEALLRLKHTLDDPPYNFVLHTSPATETVPRRPGYWQTLEFDFHWHLEIIPGLTRVAGFEWGTGFYINPMPPEDAARYLREACL